MVVVYMSETTADFKDVSRYSLKKCCKYAVASVLDEPTTAQLRDVRASLIVTFTAL